MANDILIFGKNTWPFTTEAREAHKKAGKKFEYVDIYSSTAKLDTMLKYSKGVRKVPVIVDAGKVTVGWKGNSWGV